MDEPEVPPCMVVTLPPFGIIRPRPWKELIPTPEPWDSDSSNSESSLAASSSYTPDNLEQTILLRYSEFGSFFGNFDNLPGYTSYSLQSHWYKDPTVESSDEN